MRVEDKTGGKEERRILTGMIVNKQVLSRIHGRWEQKLFESPWANLVASWCIKHYDKYKRPPKAEVETLYDRWAAKATHDKATVEIVGRFLGGLSDEYKRGNKINVDFLMDRADQYFKKIRFKRLAEDIKACVDSDDVEKAQVIYDKYKHIDLGPSEFTDPYTQIDIHQRAFDHKVEQMVNYPGVAGWFFQELLARDCFVAIQAPMKRQKSFILFDIVHRALMERRKVCYFQIGDMSESQVTRRQQARMCNQPVKAKKYWFVTSLKATKDGYKPRGEWREAKSDLTIKRIKRAQREFRDRYIKSKKSYLRQLVQPVMGMADIRNRIMQLQDSEDFTPDVVVIDYADLLQAPKGLKDDKREQINENWKDLRRLSLELHCLLVTATQSNAKAHKLARQGRSSFSDNQLKQAHVTSMVGINANEAELKDNVARLELLFSREGVHPEGTQIYTANCLALANPIIRSCKFRVAR